MAIPGRGSVSNEATKAVAAHWVSGVEKQRRAILQQPCRRKKDGGDLPQENDPRDGQVGQARRKSDQLIEDCRLKLQSEKIGIVREESRIQIAFDGREIEGIILEAGMVAHQHKSKYGQPARTSKFRAEKSSWPIRCAEELGLACIPVGNAGDVKRCVRIPCEERSRFRVRLQVCGQCR